MLTIERPAFSDILAAWQPIAFVGVFSCGVAYTCQMLGQRRVAAPIASLIMSMESVFAAVFGALLLGETMTGREIAGSVLMFLAILLVQLWRAGVGGRGAWSRRRQIAEQGQAKQERVLIDAARGGSGDESLRIDKVGNWGLRLAVGLNCAAILVEKQRQRERFAAVKGLRLAARLSALRVNGQENNLFAVFLIGALQRLQFRQFLFSFAVPEVQQHRRSQIVEQRDALALFRYKGAIVGGVHGETRALRIGHGRADAGEEGSLPCRTHGHNQDMPADQQRGQRGQQGEAIAFDVHGYTSSVTAVQDASSGMHSACTPLAGENGAPSVYSTRPSSVTRTQANPSAPWP